MAHVPFRVDFHACAPVQMDYMSTHLDGLIAWAYLQEQMAAFTKGEIDVPPNPADVNSELYCALPLKQENGVYCSSMILPQEILGSSTRYFTRSSDATVLASIAIDDRETRCGVIRNQSRMNKIETARGELKTYLMQEQLCHSPVFCAYGIGEIGKVADLLQRHVYGLGKNRAKGFGSLSRIEVFDDEDALEYWKLRALPEKGEGTVSVITPTRPPYWNKKIAQIAYIPKSVL